MEKSVGSNIGVDSEIGPLRDVVCHTPGPELLAVTPTTRSGFLYDDVIDMDQARREHQRFTAVLSRFARVHQVRSLLQDIMEMPDVRPVLIERVMHVTQSEPLGRQLMEMPASDLVSRFIEGREAEPGPLQRMLNVSSYDLPPLPNLMFTRDTAMVVGDGVLIGAMRHSARWSEEILVRALFTCHPALSNAGLTYDGAEERRAGYTLEGGDVHVLRPDLVVVGLSERSSPAAFDCIADRLVTQLGVKDILLVVLPPDRAMIHLDMVFSVIDNDHCVVFPPMFVGPQRATVLHYHAGKGGMRQMPDIFAALKEVGMPLRPVYCGGQKRIHQEREQWASGCNFVAIRPGLIIGYARNEWTFRELEQEAGYQVVDADDFLVGAADVAEGHYAIMFGGGELVRGGGGARCMTLPVRRESIW